MTVLDLKNTFATDAGLAKLVACQQLKSLNLHRSSQLTNAGMAHLAKLPNLTYLTLLYTRITDPGVEQLAKCKKLRLLDIRGCMVTDEGLAHLAGMKNLAALKIRTRRRH